MLLHDPAVGVIAGGVVALVDHLHRTLHVQSCTLLRHLGLTRRASSCMARCPLERAVRKTSWMKSRTGKSLSCCCHMVGLQSSTPSAPEKLGAGRREQEEGHLV